MAKTKQQKNKNEVGFLYKHLALGAELRSEEPKKPFPGGRIKQVFAVFSADMNLLMKMNCWLFLFAIPLFFVVLWCTTYFAEKAITGFSYIGNVGMGYPGGADSIIDGQIALYDAYQIILYLVVPALMILSIGLAGAFNTFKAAMWGEKLEGMTKMFFRGIKKYWWKYLIVGTFDALLILALGSTFIYFLSLKVQGLATAGHYVMLVFVCIIEFLLLYVNILLLPLLSELDVSFGKQIKDAIILSIKMAPIGIPLFIVCLLPIALLFVDNSFLAIILIVLIIMFAGILYGLIFTGFSQYALDNVIAPLYKLQQNPKALDKNNKVKAKPQDYKKSQKGKK